MPKETKSRNLAAPQTPLRQTRQQTTSPYFQDPSNLPGSNNSTKLGKRSRTRTPYGQEVIEVNKKNIATTSKHLRVQEVTLVDKFKEIPPDDTSSGRINVPDLEHVKLARRPRVSSTPSMKNLRLVLRNTHSDRTVPMIVRLLHIKPQLLQGLLFHKPWWLLIAVILLNKTTGRAAKPVLCKIMSRWPDMKALAQACVPELQELLTPLGLAAMRTQRLILFANMYLHDPPSQSNLRPSRVQVAKGEEKYPSTAISHLPGMGRYALDSYRLLCCKLVGEDDWKTVNPLDKELRVYVRWRWAVIGKVWDSARGVVGPVTEEYLNDLCEGRLNPDCSAPAYILRSR